MLNVYDKFTESTLFLWVILVGVCTTLFTTTGFIGVAHRNTKQASWLLVAASVVAFGVSFFFAGNMLLAGTLPFVALLFMRKIIITKLCTKV